MIKLFNFCFFLFTVIVYAVSKPTNEPIEFYDYIELLKSYKNETSFETQKENDDLNNDYFNNDYVNFDETNSTVNSTAFNGFEQVTVSQNEEEKPIDNSSNDNDRRFSYWDIEENIEPFNEITNNDDENVSISDTNNDYNGSGTIDSISKSIYNEQSSLNDDSSMNEYIINDTENDDDRIFIQSNSINKNIDNYAKFIRYLLNDKNDYFDSNEVLGAHNIESIYKPKYLSFFNKNPKQLIMEYKKSEVSFDKEVKSKLLLFIKN